MNLSKSQYRMAAQCPKMLWLDKFHEEEFDASCINPSVLENGIEVEKLARGLFGEYKEITYSKNHNEMFDNTINLLEQGVSIIAGASFYYEGLFCKIDMLKNFGDKVIEIYEVKSSTDIDDIDLDEVAYEYYVLTAIGFQVKKACLVYINNNYVRHGEIELSKLFTIKDVTETAKQHYDKLHNYVANLKEYMKQTEEPKEDIGEYCFEPEKCGFFNFCTRRLPKPNVFNIARLNKKKKIKFYRDGAFSYEKLREKENLSPAQRLQIEYELNPMPPHIELNEIRSFLRQLSYPLYFLDFETFNPAIPIYDHSKPYEQITFQYSLHIMVREGGELSHKEFLGNPFQDPRRELAERLINDIPINVCTILLRLLKFTTKNVERYVTVNTP